MKNKNKIKNIEITKDIKFEDITALKNKKFKDVTVSKDKKIKSITTLKDRKYKDITTSKSKKNKDITSSKDRKFKSLKKSKNEINEIIKSLTFWKKDFIKRDLNNNLIINSSGGDFFPNKPISIIAPYCFVFGFGSLLLGITSSLYSFFLPKEQAVWLFLVFVFNMILLWRMNILTSIETQFIFSSKGIDINSKKGSLFIQKEDIKDIYIEEVEEIGEPEYNKKEVYYINYHIIFTFKKKIYIPYAKTYREKITFIPEQIFRDYVRAKQNFSKIKASYIVQEIKKALDFNM